MLHYQTPGTGLWLSLSFVRFPLPSVSANGNIWHEDVLYVREAGKPVCDLVVQVLLNRRIVHDLTGVLVGSASDVT